MSADVPLFGCRPKDPGRAHGVEDDVKAGSSDLAVTTSQIQGVTTSTWFQKARRVEAFFMMMMMMSRS